MSCTERKSTLWSKYSGSIMKVWGENAASEMHNNEKKDKERWNQSVRKLPSFCLRLTLYPFRFIAFACACVFVLAPSLFLSLLTPFEGNSYCGKGFTAGKELLLCVPSFMETKTHLLCVAFRTYSSCLTSKLGAYFTLSTFWVVLTAKEKHDYQLLGKGPMRLHGHTIAPKLLF